MDPTHLDFHLVTWHADYTQNEIRKDKSEVSCKLSHSLSLTGLCSSPFLVREMLLASDRRITDHAVIM